MTLATAQYGEDVTGVDALNKSRGFILLDRSETRFIYVTFLLLGLVRILGMFSVPFTDTTEARYAEIARKMVETGDWITPQFAYGVPFWGKPPLHTWLSAGGMELFGVNGFGARILIFITAIALLWLLFKWAARTIGDGAALLSTAVLASACLFFGAAAFVMTDLAMVFGTSLSMMAFWSVTRDRKTDLWGYLFFVGLAIGMLAKGPVAVVLTGLPIFLWLLIGWRWSVLKHLPWLSGTLVFVALAAPWYIAAELKTPGFLRYFIIGEHYERFVVSGWQGDLYGSGHARAKGAIWLDWPVTFLPWSIFGLALLGRIGKILGAFKSDGLGWRSYLLLWTIAPMLLFTPAANILAAYALPGLPAASLLFVVLWGDAFGLTPGRWSKAAFAGGIGFVLLLFFAVGLTAAINPAALNPAALNFRSDKLLIQALKDQNPEATLHHLDHRSYSSEFYTSGQTHVVLGLNGLQQLAQNNRQDAVAISRSKLLLVGSQIPATFEKIGRYGRHVLFVERTATETN